MTPEELLQKLESGGPADHGEVREPTLRELLTLLPGREVRDAKEPDGLKQTGTVLLRKRIRARGCRAILKVYDSGIATYGIEGHRVKLRVAEDEEVVWYSVKDPPVRMRQKHFLDEPWTLYLSLRGENRLGLNQIVTDEKYLDTWKGFEEREFELYYEPFKDIPETTPELRFLRRWWSQQDAESQKLLRLMYQYRLKQERIALRMGITQAAVSQKLNALLCQARCQAEAEGLTVRQNDIRYRKQTKKEQKEKR